MSAYGNIFDILPFVQLLVDETNAEQEMLESVSLSYFALGLGSDVTVDEMYMVLAHCVLMDIVQKPTLRS
jgi:hypothetical protein